MVRTAQGPFPIEATYTWEAEGSGRTWMTVRNRDETSGFATVAAPALCAAMRRADIQSWPGF